MAQTTRTAAARTPDATARPGRSFRTGADFETFAVSLRRALVPASALENLLADRLILAAWRLQLASALEFDAALLGEDLPPLSRETFDAEHDLGKALELLESSRAARIGRDDRPAPEPEPEPAQSADDFADVYPCDEADLSNEWPTLPETEQEEEEEEEETPADPRWQDRLVFDFNVSETSPVVKGTWVTVGHVVSLIVDGWEWSDVLRTHPELTEDDVRVCLAYSVEHDDGVGE